MPNYATCTIMGHLGRDVELRQTPSGNPVANFSIATSRKRKDEETTTWWRVSMFGKRAEVLAKYLGKGDPVLVTGEPFMREWTDKEGNTRQTLELAASDFAFVGGADGARGAKEGQRTGYGAETPSRAAQGASAASQGGGGHAGSDGLDDDIPFHERCEL